MSGLWKTSVLSLVAVCALDDPIRELGRAFQPSRDPLGGLAGREAALDGVAGEDGEELCERLIAAYRVLEREAEPYDEGRREYLESGARDRDRELRPELDALRALQDRVLVLLAGLEAPDARELAIDEALGNDDFPFLLRYELAGHAAHVGVDALSGVERRLARARRAGDLAVALRVAALVGEPLRGSSSEVVDALEHDATAVRELAAVAAANLGAREGVAALVARLPLEQAHARARMVSALHVLTGLSLGRSIATWQRWFEAEGEAFLAGAPELGVGQPYRSPPESETRYHGIPLEGESIVFLFDKSRSMQQPMVGGQPGAGREAAPGEASRIGFAKDALVRALGELRPAQRFEVLAFGGTLERYAGELVDADEDEVAAAQRWVDALEMNYGTRMYDALDLAFRAMGRASEDRFYDPRADTIFLMTDGRPVAAGERDDPARILSAVRRWNPTRRVVVHTIGLGDELPVELLQALADQNGGEFVHVREEDG